MSDYLFAYGFLKRTYHGSRETRTPLMDVTFISTGLYRGTIYRVATYPGVIYDPKGNYGVHGEIFRINSPEILLPLLDRYEHASPLIDTDPEYQRVVRTIKTPQGLLDCWVYEYLKPVYPDQQIPEGIF